MGGGYNILKSFKAYNVERKDTMRKKSALFVTLAMVCAIVFASVTATFAGSDIVRKQTRTSKVGKNSSLVECTVTYRYKNKKQLKNGKPYKVVASRAKKAKFKKSYLYSYTNGDTTLKKSGNGYVVKTTGVWFTVGEKKGVTVHHEINGYKAPQK